MLRSALLLVALTCSQTALSAQYYVAPNGNDANPGTRDAPWRTISKANATLVAGDTVYLRGGTYRRDQIRPARSGTPGKPIVYRAFDGERPIIDMGTPFTQRWTKVSGTEGVDAVYEAPFPHSTSDFYSIAQDDTERSGPHTMWWRKDGCCKPRNGPNTLNTIEGPGQFYFGGAGIRARGATSQDLNKSVLVGVGSTGHTYAGLVLDQSHITIDGITFVNMGSFARRSTSGTVTNFVMQNCTVKHLAFTITLDRVEDVVWRGNWFEGLGIYMADTGEVGFTTGSRRVLIENNTFAWGAHNALFIGNRASLASGDNSHFIVRGNRFRDGGRQLLVRKVQDILIEDNEFMYSAPRSHSMTRLGHDNQAIKIYGSRAIVRNNRIWRHGGGAVYLLAIGSDTVETIHANDNRVYHNTITGGQGENWGAIVLHKGIDQTSAQMTGNVVVNNILAGNSIAEVQFLGAVSRSGNRVENNLTTEKPGFMSFAAGKVWPSRASPVDRNPDLRLAAGSPAIDSAEPLTYTKEAGYGRVVRVQDSRFFTDGFGLIDGDRIAIGQNADVEVVGVRHSSGEITLSREISWEAGDAVSLPYSGSGPDYGALEYRDSRFVAPREPRLN